MNLFWLPLTFSLGLAPPTKPPITLPGYFSCRASLLTSDANAALACYAPTQRGCQQGRVILAYERRLASPGGGTSFTIVDTVQLTLREAYHDLSISRCAVGAGPPRQYFVLCKRPALGQEYLRHVLRVWGVSAQGKLVELPTKTLRCLNGDFGA